MAVSASTGQLPKNNEKVVYKDWYPVIKDELQQKGNNERQAVELNKLRAIKDCGRVGVRQFEGSTTHVFKIEAGAHKIDSPISDGKQRATVIFGLYCAFDRTLCAS